ncbi:MAG: hypothetical protein AAF235_07550 [Planctomycetota bacterium]
MTSTPANAAVTSTVEVIGAAGETDLLDELETADSGLERLIARISYTRTFAIQGDTQLRRGTLFYEREAPAVGPGAAEKGDAGANKPVPTRRFAIRFDELVVGGRSEQLEQMYVFDGEWVVEKVPADRQFTKRQVVPPGETFDPLRIGEGPFPVPLGQRKADILSRFIASEPDSADGIPPAFEGFAIDKKLRQLRLVPRQGSAESASFDEIRVWYREIELPSGGTTLLPQIARTIEPTGDESLVILLDLDPNGAPLGDVFDTTTPPRDEAWNVHIQPWRGSADDAEAGSDASMAPG